MVWLVGWELSPVISIYSLDIQLRREEVRREDEWVKGEEESEDVRACLCLCVRSCVRARARAGARVRGRMGCHRVMGMLAMSRYPPPHTHTHTSRHVRDT